ncbi:hypothetical protein Goklo_011466, partial [Gossypium klotzschianum]|nr:hypothetical protein [Gossypium klotzschianum]
MGLQHWQSGFFISWWRNCYSSDMCCCCTN